MPKRTRRPPPSLAKLRRDYERCRRELAALGPISQGSVQDRTGRRGGGAGYQWTRKVAAKTVTVALTQEQFVALREAVANRRKLTKLIGRMEGLSRQILFQAHPHPARRKPLSKKVLGLN